MVPFQIRAIISMPELELGQGTLFYGLSFLKTRLVRNNEPPEMNTRGPVEWYGPFIALKDK